MRLGILLLASACTTEQIFERCGCEGSEVCIREPRGIRRCAPSPPSCPIDTCDLGGAGVEVGEAPTCSDDIHALCAPGTEWGSSQCSSMPGESRVIVLDCEEAE